MRSRIYFTQTTTMSVATVCILQIPKIDTTEKEIQILITEI